MKFKKKVKINTSDFYYDLFEGGYIKPDKLLKNKEDIESLQNAIEIIRKFMESAEEQDIINYH